MKCAKCKKEFKVITFKGVYRCFRKNCYNCSPITRSIYVKGKTKVIKLVDKRILKKFMYLEK